MIIPDMEKLYSPYTKDGGTIEGAIRWMKKTTGASDDVIQSVVAETFIELARGRSFIGPCDCGCGMQNSHTAIEHYMGNKVRELKIKAEREYAAKIQEGIQAAILAHIKAENDAYLADNMRKNRLVDWSRSPVLNGIKKVTAWIGSR